VTLALRSPIAPRTRTILLGVAVATVLADSSVVTLALPDILRRYHVEITEVAWVLTSFNLLMALLAVPAAALARHRAASVTSIGALVFIAASASCAFAPSFGTLLAGRSVQAIGGAAVVCGALALLAGDGDERAAHTWGLAGIVGAAVGPAIGGALTQVAGWESIFLVQVPILLVALPAMRGRATTGGEGRPHVDVVANAILLLLSAALTAALFLLVLLLVEGWRRSPLQAGITVSVMPIAALAGARLSFAGRAVQAATGVTLIAGGLGALALLPRATPWFTVPPQVLIGVGLGAALPALIGAALRDRHPLVRHGAWTIASRHAGVVLGLLVLSPLFSTDLVTASDQALQAGAAILIDSKVPAGQKLSLAGDVIDAADAAGGRIPDIDPVFAKRPQTAAYAHVQAGLHDQLDRAATHAFSRSFWAAAGLALAALAMIGIGRRRLA
jgi:MFS family permease